MSLKLFIVLSVLIVIAMVVSLSIGSVPISFNDIYKSIIGETISQNTSLILYEIRMPRILMALLVGMLLASSGAIVQSLFANPIADPYVIGIAASATFGAVVAYLFDLPDIAYGLLGFISCAVFSLIIFKISRRGGIATLLIVGIALSSFLGAFTSFAVYLIGEDSFKIVSWLMGYFGSASWQKVYLLSVPAIFSMIYFYFKRHELDVMLLGDDEAKSLGVDTARLKRTLLIVSSLSIAFSVAFTGLIGFVGLIIPHAIRLLIRSSSNVALLPLSALFGGLFLLVCDTFGRTMLDPVEIPIGIITAFFGAPFFLYLAMSRRGSI